MHSAKLVNDMDNVLFDIEGGLQNHDPITLYFDKCTDTKHKYKITYLNEKGKVLHIKFGDVQESLDCRKSFANAQYYVANHRKRQDWTKSGLNTAGFWDMHLLHDFKHQTFDSAIKNIKEKFNINVIKLFPEN